MELTRLDRNIATNIIDFGIYKEDETLTKNIAVYFAREFQRGAQENLFGEKVLDPVHFAKTMGYKNYRSLINPHPNPYQLEGKSEGERLHLKTQAKAGEITLWDTILCNALYKLKAITLILSKAGRTPNGETMDSLSEIHFIKRDSLKKIFHPVTHKIHYLYELDEVFVNNLARYFFQANITVFAGLRKSGLQDFYLELLELRQKATPDPAGNITVDWLNFDKLCSMAKTNRTEFSDKKKYLNNAVKKINNLAGDTFLSLEWVQNGRFNGKPILRFTDSQAPAEITNDHKERFRLHMFTNLKKKFRELHPFIESELTYKQTLTRWLQNVDVNADIKLKTFLDTHIQCYAKPVKDKFDTKIFNYMRVDVPAMAKTV